MSGTKKNTRLLFTERCGSIFDNPVLYAARLPFRAARGFASSSFLEFAFAKWVYTNNIINDDNCQFDVPGSTQI